MTSDIMSFGKVLETTCDRSRPGRLQASHEGGGRLRALENAYLRSDGNGQMLA